MSEYGAPEEAANFSVKKPDSDAATQAQVIESGAKPAATEYIPPEGAVKIDQRPATSEGGPPLLAGQIWLEQSDPDTTVFTTVNGAGGGDSLGLRDWSRYTVDRSKAQTTLYISSTSPSIHGKSLTLTGEQHNEWVFIADQLTK